jgi:putative NIF3 family GTP cyclohydrolase 1 type 2
MSVSRRDFARLAGTVALGGTSLAGRSAPVTAQQVVERIQNNVGFPWTDSPLDTFKSGDPAVPISGIAVTAMATLDVIKRALRQKANFVITLEPTFFMRLDGQPDPNAFGGALGATSFPADDPVVKGKQEFLRKINVLVWRFEHWRTHKPDPMRTGLANALGWSKYQVGADPGTYELPEETLSGIVEHAATRLGTHAGIRVIGDPQSRVRRVMLLPGVTPLLSTVKALPDCDVVLAGETREWESVEYARDTVAAGQKKGFIVVGKLASEEPGMSLCADWLKPLVSEVPVHWLAAGDPYWRPA